MSWLGLLDVIGAVLLLLGAVMCLIGSIGLVRFRQLYMRMHAATKPQVMGLLLILGGLALTLRTWSALGTLVLVAVSQAFTAPVSAHMLGRAAYRQGVVRPSNFDRDELDEAYRRTGGSGPRLGPGERA